MKTTELRATLAVTYNTLLSSEAFAIGAVDMTQDILFIRKTVPLNCNELLEHLIVAHSVCRILSVSASDINFDQNNLRY
jgi:hypothetical protein